MKPLSTIPAKKYASQWRGIKAKKARAVDGDSEYDMRENRDYHTFSSKRIGRDRLQAVRSIRLSIRFYEQERSHTARQESGPTERGEKEKLVTIALLYLVGTRSAPCPKNESISFTIAVSSGAHVRGSERISVASGITKVVVYFSPLLIDSTVMDSSAASYVKMAASPP
jgi:hypothetical protein